MERGTTPKLPPRGKRRGRGKSAPRVSIKEQILKAAAPDGSRFKGYENFVVQDLVLSARVIRYRRERWVTPEGHAIVAALPPSVSGHFGPELRRFVRLQHHQGQVTVERLTAQLRAIGVSISKRQVTRLLIDGQEVFLAESRDVLRVGLQTAAWITVDDTGARHAGKNGFCTQIGNNSFTWFGTRASKSITEPHTGHVVPLGTAGRHAGQTRRNADRDQTAAPRTCRVRRHDQFVQFLTRNLTEYGVRKLVPDQAALDQHARGVITRALLNRRLDALRTEIDIEAALPDDLPSRGIAVARAVAALVRRWHPR
jgi:hypothetical protein